MTTELELLWLLIGGDLGAELIPDSNLLTFGGIGGVLGVFNTVLRLVSNGLPKGLLALAFKLGVVV